MTECELLETLVPAKVYAELIEAARKYEINTPLRMSHFLAQCAHESGGFTRTVENLNYSAAGLLRVFPKYFTRRQAFQYEHKPVRIGSRVYANRMGNGNEASGEGYKYRGRGYIQLTGKDNYKLLNPEVAEDIVANPNLIADKYPLLSAAWYWKGRGLNERSDLGVGEVANITLIVNGGNKGLQDRQNRFEKYYAELKQFEVV